MEYSQWLYLYGADDVSIPMLFLFANDGKTLLKAMAASDSNLKATMEEPSKWESGIFKALFWDFKICTHTDTFVTETAVMDGVLSNLILWYTF